MEIKHGTHITTASGQDLGQVERVVIDPKTRMVTHLVVQKGTFFSQSKVVPADRIAASQEDDRILLVYDIGDPEDLPDFEETYTISVEGEDFAEAYPTGAIMPDYWYPPAGTPTGYGYPYMGHLFSYATDSNIPAGSVALKEGARVVSSDGEQVGSVEEIMIETTQDLASHFLISQGLLFKERKLVPTAWISNLEEDEVHLSVSRGLLERLPAYREEED